MIAYRKKPCCKPLFSAAAGGKILLLLFTGVLCTTLFSCKKQETKVLERQELFTVDYGNFEDQINLFQLNSPYSRPDSQIYMKDGFFYISNSASGKIMKMTSFGDLLSLYYNPDTNPEPLFAVSEEKETLTTRTAVMYPLNHPSYLIVTNKKHLFVVDTLPDDRIEYDKTENAALRTIIVQFDENGNFVDTIGQEGIGGTPFSMISGLYTNAENELIVMSRAEKKTTVFWYHASGSLLYKIPIAFNSIPVPDTVNGTCFSNIDKIVPDYTEKKLYIKVDYYQEEIDPATNVNAGISYSSSRLYTFKIQTKQYEEYININPYEGTEAVAEGQTEFTKVYNLLGVTAGKWCFLTTPVADGYVLEMLHIPTRKVYRRNLTVAPDELTYNVFNLEPNGILSALIAQNDQAALVWWRTDEIIGTKRNAR